MWYYGITQSQLCNNDNSYNNDSVWFELFGGLLWCQNSWYTGGICDNKGGYFAWEHPFPKVLGHMGGSDTNEGDSTEVRVQYVKVYAILYIGH